MVGVPSGAERLGPARPSRHRDFPVVKTRGKGEDISVPDAEGSMNGYYLVAAFLLAFYLIGSLIKLPKA